MVEISPKKFTFYQNSIFKGAIDRIEENHVAFCTACGWILFDQDERSPLLEDLLSDIFLEIIPPDALIVDGLEDHPVLIEAHAKSLHYESLSLRYVFPIANKKLHYAPEIFQM